MTDPSCLDALDDQALDLLPFGVIRLGPTGTVERYNTAEARRAGTQRWRVLGRDFFHDVIGSGGDRLASEVRAVPPGGTARVPFAFRRLRGPVPVTIDIARATDDRVYLCIRDAG